MVYILGVLLTLCQHTDYFVCFDFLCLCGAMCAWLSGADDNGGCGTAAYSHLKFRNSFIFTNKPPALCSISAQPIATLRISNNHFPLFLFVYVNIFGQDHLYHTYTHACERQLCEECLFSELFLTRKQICTQFVWYFQLFLLRQKGKKCLLHTFLFGSKVHR